MSKKAMVINLGILKSVIEERIPLMRCKPHNLNMIIKEHEIRIHCDHCENSYRIHKDEYRNNFTKIESEW